MANRRRVDSAYKREMRRARARAHCEICGAPGEEVHHRVRIKDGGKTEPANLQLLCKECHKKVHQKLRAKRDKLYKERLKWREYHERRFGTGLS